MNRKILKFIKANLNTLQDLDVLVTGDVGTDVYYKLKTIKDSPECPGTPVVALEHIIYRAGMAGNVANNVAQLVDNTRLTSVCRDFSASYLHPNVNYEIVAAYNRLSTTKTRYTIDGNQVFRLDKEDTHDISSDLENELIIRIKQSKVQSIILSDYRKGVLTNGILESMNNDIPTIIDAHKNTPAHLGKFSVFKVNDREAITIIQPKATDIVVTYGERGLGLYNSSKPEQLVPAFTTKAVDVSGAGDSVTAGIGVGLAAGWSTLEGCYLGSLMAAVTVQKLGTASATKSEIETLIKELLK